MILAAALLSVCFFDMDYGPPRAGKVCWSSLCPGLPPFPFAGQLRMDWPECPPVSKNADMISNSEVHFLSLGPVFPTLLFPGPAFPPVCQPEVWGLAPPSLPLRHWIFLGQDASHGPALDPEASTPEIVWNASELLSHFHIDSDFASGKNNM